MTQRQDSVSDQMAEVLRLAREAGCYDAVDWIKRRWVDPCPECHGRGFRSHSAHGGDSSKDQGWYTAWSEMCVACRGTGKRQARVAASV